MELTDRPLVGAGLSRTLMIKSDRPSSGRDTGEDEIIEQRPLVRFSLVQVYSGLRVNLFFY